MTLREKIESIIKNNETYRGKDYAYTISNKHKKMLSQSLSTLMEAEVLREKIGCLESIKMKLYSLGRINRSDVIDEDIKRYHKQLKELEEPTE